MSKREGPADDGANPQGLFDASILSQQLDRRREATYRLPPIDDKGTRDPHAARATINQGSVRASKWLRVIWDEQNDAVFIAGFEAGKLVIACGGKPMWSAPRHAWMTNKRVGRNLLALADKERYAIDLSEVPA
jgi:hypothetical protein